MNSKALILALLLSACGGAEAAVELQPPQRNYGYMLGDVVTVTALIVEDDGYRLDRNSLPQPGALNDWLVLKEVQLHTASAPHDHRLQLTYQLFKSVRETVTLQIPELPLAFSNGRDVRQQAVPAWTIYYSALIPANLSDSEIVLQPADIPRFLDTRWQQRSLYVLIAVSAILLLYLVWIYDRLPYVRRYAGPFGKACRALEKLQRQGGGEDTHRQALHCLHQAVNATAGETVFFTTLETFLQARPAFQAARLPLEKLYRRSEAVFFTDRPVLTDTAALAEILDACRLCRKIERSSRWL
ncbi:MAG: hypothetical protein ACU837_16505 [Gammaproteobacteria bacterium]